MTRQGIQTIAVLISALWWSACLESTNTCPSNQIQPAGFSQCICATGFIDPANPANGQYQCVDACSVNSGGCGTGGLCTHAGDNTVQCSCTAGYVLVDAGSTDGGPTVTCTDPCTTPDNGGCPTGALCQHAADHSVTCGCPTGTELSVDGAKCVTDPCSLPSPCGVTVDGTSPAGTCVSSGGVATCSCASGYVLSNGACVSVCAAGSNGATGPCPSTSACSVDPTNGSAVCACSTPNTQWNSTHTACVIDPCSVSSPCGVTADGTSPAGTCVSSGTEKICSCVPGYVFNGTTCVGVCSTNGGLGPCPMNSTCVADTVSASGTPASVATCLCQSPFEWNGTQTACVQDPCVATVSSPTCGKLPDGAPAGTCVSVGGSYSCECQPGYVFSGGTCVSACAPGDGGWLGPCPPTSTCTPDPATSAAICTCPAGDEWNGTQTACTSDPCDAGSGTPTCGVEPDGGSAGMCVSSSGSYACDCARGFVFSGGTCVSVCASAAGGGAGPCPSSAVCTPAPTTGEAACSCGPHTQWNSTDTACVADPCSPASGATTCGAGGTCLSSAGAFTCECPVGTVFNGTTCVDACSVDGGGCASNSTCGHGTGTNAVQCSCNATYEQGPGGVGCVLDPCATAGACGAGAGTCTSAAGVKSCACAAGYANTLSGMCAANPCSTGNGGCGAGTCNTVLTESGLVASCSCQAGQTLCGGSGCTDTQTDELNCGECGIGPSTFAGVAALKCDLGQPTITACDAGYHECSSTPTEGDVAAEGCVNLQTDDGTIGSLINCGTCGGTYAPSNYVGVASLACVDGGPSVNGCSGSFTRCSTAPQTAPTDVSGAGCANLSTDPLNCGACGESAASYYGVASISCSGSTATITACDANHPKMCSNVPATTDVSGAGCANLTADPLNCGACGNDASSYYGVASISCSGSTPTITACDTSHPKMCSAAPATTDMSGAGCANLTTDPLNCGACGESAASYYGVASISCSGSTATITACDANHPKMCTAVPAPTDISGAGCADLTTDPLNCGACGESAASYYGVASISCSGSTPTITACDTSHPKMCSAAPATTDMSGAGCANLSNDPLNCGACGTSGPSFYGVLSILCSSSTPTITACDASHPKLCSSVPATTDVSNAGCADLTNDALNCGTCGTKCGSGHSCVNKVCN